MKKVLLIDDQLDSILDILSSELQRYDFEVAGEEDPGKAVQRIKQEKPDAILLDIMFPGDSQDVNLGKPTLKKIKKTFPSLPVVMLTSTLTDAEFGIDEEDFNLADGLFTKDILFKTTDFEQEISESANPFYDLAEDINDAIEKQAANKQSLDERLAFIVGETPAMKNLAKLIIRGAETDVTVLLTGESGTGKELAAQAIHRLSSRKGCPFQALNCGGFTETTLESRFFGHTKNAFTGADKETKGYFGEAEGGTLFLDEIEAMSTRMQEMLLRALQEKKITRMGSTEEKFVDVRIIAATNRNLLEMIDQGSFRRDLYERINVYPITLPPLRERLQDIEALFKHFVQKMNKELGKHFMPNFREDVKARFLSYKWPGNIRELENKIQAAMIRSTSNVLTPSIFDFGEEKSQEESGLGFEGMVEAIFDKRANWEDLKNIQGPLRRKILLDLIECIKARDGKRPSSKALAELLDMTDNQMRQEIKKIGGLKQF